MFAQERQDKICEMLKKNGAVVTSDLVEIFGVSIETIRRDLLTLQENGVLSKVHGGAVSKNDIKPFSILNERMKQFDTGKKNLAEKAAELVTDGDIIGIDSGSTAVAFAQALQTKFTDLTVITHSLDVFNILNRQFQVILCGGHYMSGENAFYGALTLNTIEQLHIKKAFVCPTAVSLEYGIFDYQNELYQVQKALMKAAEETVILADSSKFEKTALLKIDDMKNEYIYVTDCGLPSELRRLYATNNIEIYTGKNKN